jgi:hypothetical protein
MPEVGVHEDADDFAVALAELIQAAIEGQPAVSI